MIILKGQINIMFDHSKTVRKGYTNKQQETEGNSRAEEAELKHWSAFLLCLWATALRKSRSAHQVVDCATVWCSTLPRMLFLYNTHVQGTVQCISLYSITENSYLKGDGKLRQRFWNIFSKVQPLPCPRTPRSDPPLNRDSCEPCCFYTGKAFTLEKLPSTLHPHLSPFQTACARSLKALHTFFLHWLVFCSIYLLSFPLCH